MNKKSAVSLPLIAALGLGLLTPSTSLAWGERGHDLVTRVAVRLLPRLAPGSALAFQMGRKEFMLGHLSNVPDIYWRNLSEAVEKVNAPTHFLDLEYVAPELTLAAIPRTPQAALARMKELCANPPRGYVCPTKPGVSPDESSAGTAPWRVAQLYRLTVESLKNAAPGGKADPFAIDKAFLTAGIMSHFVGDLGNPYHATRNYDGWESGQGGIHSYFESAVIASYPLGFEQEVFDAALSGKGFARALSRVPEASRESASKDPALLAMALGIDSQSRLESANEMDRRFAVTRASSVGADGKRLNAERRDASELRAKFHDLHVERLATAAEVLARLWLAAWEEAGRPDFKGYQSFAYPVAPDFMAPDYLTK